jgi:hypothetical protein
MQKIGLAFGLVAAMVLAGMPAQASSVQTFSVDVTHALPGDYVDIALVNGVLSAGIIHPTTDALPSPLATGDVCATVNPVALTCDGVLNAAGANAGAYHLIVPVGIVVGLQGAGNIDSIQNFGAGGIRDWRCSLNANGVLAGAVIFSGGCGMISQPTNGNLPWTWHGAQDATIFGTPIVYVVA